MTLIVFPSFPYDLDRFATYRARSKRKKLNSDVQFDEAAQRDLLAAAVRLYEVNMFDVCMSILTILIKCNNDAAHVLYGHCISYEKYKHSEEIARKHYEIACEMGSAVGCYNVYLSYLENSSEMANKYLVMAKGLGWED